MQINKLSMLVPVKSELGEKTGNNSSSFQDLLKNAIADVNQMQIDAHNASVNLAAGKVNDISDVVIATEKAAIALQLTMQIRNKAVDAYQEIMRMQV